MTAEADSVVVSPGACDVAAIKARLVAAEPVFDGRGYFEHLTGGCGEHRTAGPHRSWCYACSEWCYASDGCAGCRPDVDVDDARALVGEVQRLREREAALIREKDRDLDDARDAVLHYRAEVERLRAALNAVRALVSDTDGNWLGPDDFDGLAGCIQEVVCDAALGVQS